MHPLTTNMSESTRDVHCFTFESSGALEITNEHSGLAVAPAHLYYFRRSQAGMSLTYNLAQGRQVMEPANTIPFSAYVGVDWADKKHDVCIQDAAGTVCEFDIIPHRV
ncbi:MAG: hypothetical protein ACE1Y4_07565 [Lysobacterales bacterium]